MRCLFKWLISEVLRGIIIFLTVIAVSRKSARITVRVSGLRLVKTYELNKFQARAFGNFPSLQESRHRANKGGNVISAI